jgi:hypothetical protein
MAEQGSKDSKLKEHAISVSLYVSVSIETEEENSL